MFNSAPAGFGCEDDGEVRAALAWLATVSGDHLAFNERLERAQHAYRVWTATPGNLGRDPRLIDIGSDVVAAYFAQAKSLIDDRRSFDVAMGSRVIPWLKGLGRNIDELAEISGAVDRASRMLRTSNVAPDSEMLELVLASNYASDGLGVTFLEETRGGENTGR
jgi:hypothetical protein